MHVYRAYKHTLTHYSESNFKKPQVHPQMAGCGRAPGLKINNSVTVKSPRWIHNVAQFCMYVMDMLHRLVAVLIHFQVVSRKFLVPS